MKDSKDSQEKRFLVLGSNSFSGAHFCNFLVSRGCSVLAVSRSKEPISAFLPYKWNSTKNGMLSFYQIDINKDQKHIINLLENKQPEYIVNFAAQSMVAQSWDYPSDWLNTNIIGLHSLLEILKDYRPLKKFLQITTPEVYGSNPLPISEDHPFRPSTPYAVSRASGDMLIKIYAERYNIPVNFTRAANVYGQGQQLYRLIPRAIMATMTKKKLILDGGGTSLRSFIHIKDVCEATFEVLTNGKEGETYHISSDKVISVRECVEEILQATKKKFDDAVTLGPERPGKDAIYMLSSQKIRDELNWKEKVEFSTGISQVIAWVSDNLEIFEELGLEYEHKT